MFCLYCGDLSFHGRGVGQRSLWNVGFLRKGKASHVVCDGGGGGCMRLCVERNKGLDRDDDD